jgi:hypothetical protein
MLRKSKLNIMGLIRICSGMSRRSTCVTHCSPSATTIKTIPVMLTLQTKVQFNSVSYSSVTFLWITLYLQMLCIFFTRGTPLLVKDIWRSPQNVAPRKRVRNYTWPYENLPKNAGIWKQNITTCRRKLSIMKYMKWLFLTTTCEYTISYKNSRHTWNPVVAHRLRNTGRPRGPTSVTCTSMSTIDYVRCTVLLIADLMFP